MSSEFKGISYLKFMKNFHYAQNSKIWFDGNNIFPVLIGVDNRPGAPLANADNSTDHYVVIVGMGTDDKGKYLQFVDSATNNRSNGASWSNRLYFDAATGKITGKTAIEGYRTQQGMRDYTITQVRKSIKK